MKTALRRGAILAWFAVGGLAALPGCSDVGDSSAVPCGGTSDGAVTGDDGSLDATGAQDSTTPPGDSTVQNPDGTSPQPEAGGDDSNVPVDAPISGDDGGVDTWAPDTSTVDTGTVDAGQDASQPDANDAGGVDAGVDSAAPEASAGDAAADADASVAPDASTSLVPCTTAGQTGCVQCQGNSNGVCNATEATIVAYDIKKGFATAPGPDPAAGCYTCVLGTLGIDNPGLGVSGEDCDDLTGAGDKDKCLATLSCIFQTKCDPSGVISACYCGTAPPSGACLTGGANGLCDSQEAAGLGFAVSDGSDILKNMTSTTLPSGVANNILVSAASNSCGMCYQ